ncbi:hypothetical protein D9M68_881480 [compost metagenome]
MAAPIARKLMDYYLTGKWPAELEAMAPPASERVAGRPPVDTPSVFTTGQTASIASATVMSSGAAPASAVAAASGAQPVTPEAIAAALNAEAIAPASAVETLDQRMLQALGHSKPAPQPASAPAVQPVRAPAPKPRVKPVSAKAASGADATR